MIAEEPERKKAKKAAVDAAIAETTKNTCQRMANKYKEYTEAFKEWSKETGHGLDRQEMSDLHVTG